MKHSAKISLSIACLFGALFFHGASAASACKGLQESACQADAACRWVGGYERKDGRQVNAHCRLRPGSAKPSAAALGVKAGATD